MPRVKRGTKRHNRRKKLLGLAKGYYLNKSKLYRAAKEAVEKAGVYAYRDRKVRKREFRKLWIIRIGAAARRLSRGPPAHRVRRVRTRRPPA